MSLCLFDCLVVFYVRSLWCALRLDPSLIYRLNFRLLRKILFGFGGCGYFILFMAISFSFLFMRISSSRLFSVRFVMRVHWIRRVFCGDIIIVPTAVCSGCVCVSFWFMISVFQF